jgi:protein SCO1/2
MKYFYYVSGLVLLLVLFVDTAEAQRSGSKPHELEGVGVEEHLGETIPLDLTFTNADGEEVSLRSYFTGEKPVLLNFGYYNCPMLCDRVWGGMTASLQGLDWTPGEKFTIVTIGIAPEEAPEDASRKREKLLSRLDNVTAGSGWYFHTGEQQNIKTLADAAGFQYRKMKRSNQMDQSFHQYAHPAALVALSGNGKITRYLYGLQYEPRDMKNALMEASNGEVGNILDKVVLYCSQYDPNANKYVADAWAIMRLGGVLTVIILGGTLFVFWRREQREQQTRAPASADYRRTCHR